ncbi:MAG: zinc-dependent metalloprotease [Proteobacteria bacterium]|nr:zinc-dependent metalloprotease [Pseudomonadota bacterium]
MHKQLLALAALAVLVGCGAGRETDETSNAERVLDSYQAYPGFVNVYWDEERGRLLIQIDEFDAPFLYQSSLPRGVGSNDLGLDRGQLGDTKIVRFERSGPKVLLVEDNLAYRATSEDSNERQAVAESFARSVIWGFDVLNDTGDIVLVDGTDFFLRDAHGISRWLSDAEEGQYVTEATRSAIYLPRTKAFPDNTEVEAIVTFVGQPAGQYLPTVVPDPTAVTVHIHHSFIRLPDDDYEPLVYDPRAGGLGLYFATSGFADYAIPIGESLRRNFGLRHRLKKINPDAEVSEAVEPIVYYVDPGVPEPVRSALIEGASWWNQAFETAGYKDAFQVRLLPEDVDPIDVRYNVIQWVHRSTRGWSYGDSIVDPRTGEIIKGHVLLGSLRVRQDYLIVEGLLAPYGDQSVPATMLEVSLARIRQLSAHEVGHTIGFVHNMAASTQGRASVMDYPFPLVSFDDDGELDFSKAYDDAIGSWDERTVLFAYQDFPDDVDAQRGRQEILNETIRLGFKFVADEDSRSVSTAHPEGNLWDNGTDAIVELEHLLKVRAHALARFSERNIRLDRPMATLEEVLVPVYLLHRFQIKAVGKLVGGSYFTYTMRGDGQSNVVPVASDRQREAIDVLVAALHPDVLRLPEGIVELISPRPPGNEKTRETFDGNTGVVFDPLAPAASAVALTLDVLLDPRRAARLMRSGDPGFGEICDSLLEASWLATASQDLDAAIQRQTSLIVLTRLMQLGVNMDADADVRAIALDAVMSLDEWLESQAPDDRVLRAHFGLARYQIARLRDDPSSLDAIVPVTSPPGSPIGSFTE